MPEIARGHVAERQLAHPRTRAVRAHQQVHLARCAIGQPHRYPAAVLLGGLDAGPVRDGRAHVVGDDPGQVATEQAEHSLQPGPELEPAAGPPGTVDVTDFVDRVARLLQPLPQPHAPGHLKTGAVEVDQVAALAERLRPLDQLHLPAGAFEMPGQRQPGDAGAADQSLHASVLLVLVREPLAGSGAVCPAVNMARSGPVSAAGSRPGSSARCSMIPSSEAASSAAAASASPR